MGALKTSIERILKSSRTKKAVNGSITIFLVIVLVPVISVAGLFVDASRYQLAQSEVAAAGDLTLNAALADYDTVLKDVYGLFAVSQNDPEGLKERLSDYFTSMIVSSGAADSEADVLNNPLLQDIVDGASGIDSTSDLLSMTLSTEEGAFSANGVEGSQLSNSEVLKNQIVEFCKYRTPVNTTLSFIEGITGISKIAKQNSVTEKAAKTDEAIGDLNEACDSLFENLEAYETKAEQSAALLKWSDLETVSGRSYPDYVQNSIVPAAVAKYAVDFPDDIRVESRPSYESGWNMVYDPHNDIDLKTLTNPGGRAKSLKVWGGYSKDALDSLSVEELKSELDSNLSYLSTNRFNASLGGFSGKTISDQKNVIRSYEEAMSYAFRLWAAYESYLAALESDDERTSAEDEYQDRVDTQIRRASSLASSMNQARSSVENMIATGESDLAKAVGDYNSKLVALGDLKDLIDKCVDSMKDVEEQVGDAENANEELNGAVQSYGTDDSFGSQMKNRYDTNKILINKDDFNAMNDQLKTLQSYIGSLKSYYESSRLFGWSLDDLGSLDTLINTWEFKAEQGRISQSSQTALDLGRELGGAKFVYTGQKPDEVSPLTIANYNFYNYLLRTFGASSSSDGEDNEGSRDSIASYGESQAGATSDTSGVEDVSVSSLMTTSGGGASASIDAKRNDNDGYSDMLSSITDTVSAIVGGITEGDLLTNSRDNLYITDYVFSMFSWYTQENEYKVENGADQANLETVTGVPINADNNRLYRSEIEYLIYGNDSTSKNISSAKSQIFAVRFVSNCGYALTDREINTATLPIALGIQAASAGVIPYQLPQTVMKIALALAQAGIDLADLEKGEAVPLVHSRRTWTMSVSGALNAAKDAATEGASSVIGSAADGIKGALNALLDQGADTANVAVSDLTDDINSIAQDQARKATDALFASFSDPIVSSVGRISAKIDYAGDNAQEVANEIIDNALAAAQEFIDGGGSSALRSVLQGVYDSAIVPKAEELRGEIVAMVQVIKGSDNAGLIITELQESINTEISVLVSDNVTSVSSGIQSAISEQVSSVQGQLGDVIDSKAADLNKKVAGEIDSWFDSTFGPYTGTISSGSETVSSGSASCLKFKYSDYLKMFLFIGLIGDNSSAGVLSRVAGLIQLNINSGIVDPATGEAHALAAAGDAEGTFSMSNAYTYYEVTSKVGLSTMFLAYPLITERMGVEEVSSFAIQYHGALGY